MGYQYSYLIGCLVLLAIWAGLFFCRKDIRKEMFGISLIFGFLGILVGLVYTVDWWHPLTITGTIVGIEDFIFGFAVAGIAAVIYEFIFKKKIKSKKTSKKIAFRRNRNFLILISLGLAIFFWSYYFLRLHSFYAAIISLLITLPIIWIKRKDLILNSILSGFLLAMISFIFYIVVELMAPGWVASSWYFENLSGVVILGAPAEDLVWFFLAGLFIGPLYEYWQEARLVDKR